MLFSLVISFGYLFVGDTRGIPERIIRHGERIPRKVEKEKNKKIETFQLSSFRYIDIQRSDNKKTGSFLTLPFKISLLLFRCSRFLSSIVPASPFLARPAFGNMEIIREFSSLNP